MTGHKLLLLRPLKVSMIRNPMKKNSAQRDKCPHQFSPNLMNVSNRATGWGFAITHASLPYHSRHLPNCQMPACHSLTDWSVHESYVCWVSMWIRKGHRDIWVWDGLKRWCGGSRTARVERTASMKRLPQPVLVKAIQSIILLSTPRPLGSLVTLP